MPELSSSAPPLTRDALEEIVRSPATVLLSWHVTPETAPSSDHSRWWCSAPRPARRAWIEDVVVATDTRGRGVGAALVHEANARAGAAGSRTVDLTSRPSREAANRLYVRLGFVQRETNVYRKTLD